VSFSSAYAYHVQYRHQDRVRFDVFHGLQSPFNLLLQLCTFWLSGIQKAMIILSRAIHQIPIKSGRFFLSSKKKQPQIYGCLWIPPGKSCSFPRSISHFGFPFFRFYFVFLRFLLWES